MSNLRDFTGKNRRFSGSDSIRLPRGSTAERVTAETGEIRFNTTLSKAEYYDGSSWVIIDSPPTISSITNNTFVDATDTFTINGGNFSTSITVTCIAADGAELSPSVVTRNSSSSITCTIGSTFLTDAQTSGSDPYDIKVTNASGLAATLEDGLAYSPAFSFTTAAGTLGTLSSGARNVTNITTACGGTSPDPDDAITYSISAGALPTGVSLSSSTGAISGTANAETTTTTYNFTVQAAVDVDGLGTITNYTRAFAITVNAPVIQSFTSTGAGTFNVPIGVSSVQVLAVAGGGGGGTGNINEGGGGGGGGGMVEASSYPVSPGGTVSYNVGAAGSGGGGQGSNTVFGNITANGGGAGGNNDGGKNGGSGGGGGGASVPQPAGSATQGPSGGGTGYGNPGGQGSHNSQPGNGRGASGGGAGGTGQNGSSGGNTPGAGRSNSLSGSSVTYAQGGPGNGQPGPPANVTGSAAPGSSIGWGGQGGNSPGGGAGSKGIIIIKY